jgi:hypothetical protein
MTQPATASTLPHLHELGKGSIVLEVTRGEVVHHRLSHLEDLNLAVAWRLTALSHDTSPRALMPPDSPIGL